MEGFKFRGEGEGASEGSRERASENEGRKKLMRVVALASMGLFSKADSAGAPSDVGNFTEARERASVELKEHGITHEQEAAYTPVLSDVFYRTIGPEAALPRNTAEWRDQLSDAIGNIFEHRRIGKNGYEQGEANKGEEDGWRLYLGLPQKFDTFGISEYQPSNSKDKLRYYYKLNKPQDLHVIDTEDKEQAAFTIKRVVELIKQQDDMDVRDKKEPRHLISNTDAMTLSGVMGHFQWSSGVDHDRKYIAYYDAYDFDLPLENVQLVGKPFEIYDRIYYDADSYEPIVPQPIDRRDERD